MKHHKTCMAAMAFALLASGCTDTSETGGSYSTYHFAYSVSDSLVFEKQHDMSVYTQADYMVFRPLADPDMEMGVFEMEQIHLTIDAYCEFSGLEPLTAEDFTVNGMNGRYLTTESDVEEGKLDAYVIVGCEGAIFELDAYSITEAQLPVYETEAAEILKTLTYTGEPLQAGTFEDAYFTLGYSDRWYPHGAETAHSVKMRFSRGENTCAVFTQVTVTAEPDAGTTPEAAAEAAAAEWRESDYRTDIAIGEGEVFGRTAVMAACSNTALAGHDMEQRVYYFEEKGVQYEVFMMFCRDMQAQFMADLAQLQWQK